MPLSLPLRPARIERPLVRLCRQRRSKLRLYEEFIFNYTASFMPRITALIHTLNDSLRIGRCLETLYPCDDILIADHGSQDGTVRVAHEYAAKVIPVDVGGVLDRDLRGADWILCLDARESLSEALAASLYEWKLQPASESAFSMFLREETVEGWVQHSSPQTRLVPAGWKSWDGCLPTNQASAVQLAGEVLRFALP